MDVFSLLDLVQVESPHIQLSFVSLLGSLSEFRYHFHVRGGGKLPGDLVPFVQPLNSVHARSFSVLRFESQIDGHRILVHKLLGHGAATRLGILVPVNVLEEWSPNAALVRASGGGSVTKPRGDLLRVVSIITRLKTFDN